MAETESLIVDFTQEEDVTQVLPYPPLRSSEDLAWQGLYVQHHQQPAWETPEYAHTRHMLLIHNTNPPIQAERQFDGHRQLEQLGGETNIVLVPAQVQHRANWSQAGLFSLIFLEPDFLAQVAHESIRTNDVELIPHYATQDRFIDQIGRSLTVELQNNQLHSKLFADSLTIALSIHLLRHYANVQQPIGEYAGGLSRRKLQQVIEYINEHLASDLTIAAIADRVEMSPYHFSRLFKQSVGLSPYQYVMQQRIERSAYLLRTTTLSIAAIAIQVGFSTQNQLTIQFRKFLGITPSNYRKQL
jgi:AraC family transcriptional regulator